MQDQTNRKRLMLLVVLTIATLLAFWWVQPENRLNIDHDVFRIENIDEVSRVDLRSPTEDVRLTFDGARWRVNDDNADGNLIRVLFATLQQAQPKRPVAAVQRDSTFKALSESGVRVSLYKGEELVKEFFAGGNQAKTQAYFADPVTEDVYVMTIPGYRVYVSGILELGVSGWKEKFVFGFNWRNFKGLEVKFPGRPSDNFSVAMTRNYFGIEGMEADTARLNTFLDNVSLLTVEEYLSQPGLADSLSQAAPEMEIIVSDVANRTYRLRLFPERRSREYYGLIGDSQAALFSRRKIEALLKPRSFFSKK